MNPAPLKADFDLSDGKSLTEKAKKRIRKADRPDSRKDMGIDYPRSQHHEAKMEHSIRYRRTPFQDLLNNSYASTNRERESRKGQNGVDDRKNIDGAVNSRSIHLPDVTGLTNAVASPTRRNLSWQRYTREEQDDADGAWLLSTQWEY